MRADALGVAINRMNVDEAGCVAAAILGGVAAGTFANVMEGAKVFARVEQTFEPRPERAPQWEELFGKYKGLYDAAKQFRM